MKKISFFGKIKSWATRHKITSFIIILTIIGGGYYTYKKTTAANAAPQYVLAPARVGTITQTVTGSGQVSAENQLDVTSEVSGKIQSISVKVGQHVKKGDLLASLDSHDASISLENARIAYAKLVKPAKEGDITNAQNSLAKSYNDAFNVVSAVYLDLPEIMTGLNDMLYSQTGYLSNQKAQSLTAAARGFRNIAEQSFDKASIQYQISLSEYKGLTRASATSSIDILTADTLTTVKMVADTLQNVQNTITFVMKNQPEYQTTEATAAAANTISWSNLINNTLSSIVSAQNSITSNDNSLTTLVAGAEDLDIQSQRLSLQQSEQTYAKYFIRAPFDGIVGRIPVSVYGQAGASTVIATIVGDQKVANVSLNEVDAAKVEAGQKVNITFDAIDGLDAVGTVGQVDLVGTVSQGVVSYNVKVIISTTDDRIKPGMSLNISIVTKEKQDVLVVPSTAIKTLGNRKYVEVLASSTVMAALQANRASGNTVTTNGSGFGTGTFQRRTASTTDQVAINNPNASSTIGGNYSRASSTGQFGSSTFSQSRTMTITSATAPTQVIVTIGDSDDTNTEIVSGLDRGQLVVTRTITSGTATTATPNILSSIGGNRGATGANRAVVRPGN